MFSTNRIILIGNLGGTPELKYVTEKRTPVVNFNLATNERWKDDAGNRQEKVEWHRIVCWGGLALLVSKSLSKGSFVYVEGRNSTRKWEKDGVTHHTTEIMASRVGFLQPRDGAPADLADADYTIEPSAPPPDKDIPF
jgi:single-strand DNA-binding protein